MTRIHLFDSAWSDVIEQRDYAPSGNRGKERTFYSKGAVVHVFQPQEVLQQDCTLTALYPPSWTHDWSFWIPGKKEDFDCVMFQNKVCRWLEQAAETSVVKSMELVDSYT